MLVDYLAGFLLFFLYITPILLSIWFGYSMNRDDYEHRKFMREIEKDEDD